MIQDRIGVTVLRNMEELRHVLLELKYAQSINNNNGHHDYKDLVKSVTIELRLKSLRQEQGFLRCLHNVKD